MKVKCKKCEYEWDTKSKLIMVSCPSCGTKNNTNHNPKKDGVEKHGCK